MGKHFIYFMMFNTDRGELRQGMVDEQLPLTVDGISRVVVPRDRLAVLARHHDSRVPGTDVSPALGQGTAQCSFAAAYYRATGYISFVGLRTVHKHSEDVAEIVGELALPVPEDDTGDALLPPGEGRPLVVPPVRVAVLLGEDSPDQGYQVSWLPVPAPNLYKCDPVNAVH